MEIEHLKTSGLQDKALYDYTFSKDNGINPEIKLAHNYVSNWFLSSKCIPVRVFRIWEKLVISTGTPFSRRALAMQPAKKERDARTHRLVQEGAILESIVPHIKEMDLDFLKRELMIRLRGM